MSNPWIASDKKNLPDFIIGGMMKSGTTTLHNILNEHPKIFIPREELHFFNIDDVLVTPDFNYFDSKESNWEFQEIEKNPLIFWDWYNSFFRDKKPSDLVGEDSTGYLASKIAAYRISIQKKPIKLVFIVRNPTKRAYSEYNHLLSTGRMVHTFEDCIKYEPWMVLNKGLYTDYFKNYFDLIPRERIKIITFEQLKANPRDCLKELSSFLNISFDEFPEGTFNIHSNQAIHRKSISINLLRNKLIRSWAYSRYRKKLPLKFETSTLFNLKAKTILKIHGAVNRKVLRSKPMNPDTEHFLNRYYKQRLFGLNEIVGKDVLGDWFK
jgi:hypothetical protein